jgi:soluble lytic murein transglycosylase
LQALVSAGNYYLLQNRHERYLPLYETCAEAFPTHPRAAYCDWKVVWSHFIRRQPDAEQLLKRHLEDFPKSRKASTALYFLGRLAEESGDLDKARTYFEEVEKEYPNFYYAGRSRERLEGTRIQKADPSAQVRNFLKTIRFPRRRHRKNFTPTEATRLRLRRARLLFSAGLDRWGETELRFGARTDGQGPILAMELATSASKRKQYGKSIRYIKGLAPGYLSMPIEAAPRSFWELAFPLPYRATIEKYARRRDLDFYFLAALIRLDSEFDARGVCRAGARGLTQILSSTGRQLSRKLHIRGYRTSWLYRPDVNLNMGTYYLRSLIDELGGHTEAVLASYNAGKSRAKQWLTWADYREGTEFVETIPFTETRNYVQTVLRNADIYRELYGKKRR